MNEQLAVWHNYENVPVSHHRSFTAAQIKIQNMRGLRTGMYSIVRWHSTTLKYGKLGREYHSLLTGKTIAVILK